MSTSEWELDHIYEECVKAVTSYILRRSWYPNNNERGYMQRARLEGRKPDELVQEFVAKYGEGSLTQRVPDGLQPGQFFNPYDLNEVAQVDKLIKRRR